MLAAALDSHLSLRTTMNGASPQTFGEYEVKTPLGVTAVTPLESAVAYATLAARGVHATAYTSTGVTHASGCGSTVRPVARRWQGA